MKDFFKRVICGIGIGLGCVLPGVSGGVVAIAMGLYEKMLHALTNLFRDFKNSFCFLLPIGIGGVAGIFLTSNVLKVVLNYYEAETFSLFIGFIIGSLPTLYEETITEDHKKPGIWDIVLAVIGFTALVVLEICMPNTSTMAAGTTEALPIPLALIGGFVLGIGLVIPGLSSSFLLVYLGLYRQILDAIADLYIPTLFFAGIGVVAGAGLMVILMKFLFSRFHVKTYFVIIGVTIGTILLILPNIMKNFSWVCVLTCVIGVAFGIWQSWKKIKKVRQAEQKTEESVSGTDTGKLEDKQDSMV